jgi:cobalamin biosynthesis Co2+ chelatase CbiK
VGLNVDLVLEEPVSAELGYEIEPISSPEVVPGTEIDEILEKVTTLGKFWIERKLSQKLLNYRMEFGGFWKRNFRLILYLLKR